MPENIILGKIKKMAEKREVIFLVDKSELQLLDDVTLLMHDDAERIVSINKGKRSVVLLAELHN